MTLGTIVMSKSQWLHLKVIYMHFKFVLTACFWPPSPGFVWPDTWARYWITFFVFSVFPAPDSPLSVQENTSLEQFVWKAKLNHPPSLGVLMQRAEWSQLGNFHGYLYHVVFIAMYPTQYVVHVTSTKYTQKQESHQKVWGEWYAGQITRSNTLWPLGT